MTNRLLPAGMALLLCGALAPPAAARELWVSEDHERAVELDLALRSTLLGTRFPDIPSIFPDRHAAASLWRARPALRARGAAWIAAEVAHDLSATIDHKGEHDEQHRLDRALVILTLHPVEVTVGRQAVGWGRAVLFTAVDPFNPFDPLEVDKEWRRGFDAVRAEVTFSDVLAADALLIKDAAFGRVRGYVGDIDAELMAGRQEGAAYAGLSASSRLGESEVHGELGAYDLTAVDPIPKSTLGASHRFDLGRGLQVVAEHHYAHLAAPNRQIAGKHGIGLLTAYDLADLWLGSMAVIVSAQDGSGIAAPTLTWLAGELVTVVGALYIPWGAGPEGPWGLKPGSDYGATPWVALLQARLYL